MPKRIIKFLLLIIVVFLLTTFLCVLYQSSLWRFFVKDGQLIKLVLKDNYFSPIKKELLVEVVKNEISVQRGLSARPQLQSINGQHLDGMLFIFPESKIRQFWMKDMQFDIDICWFIEQSLISCTRRALKPEVGEAEIQLPIYQSPRPADMVLETKPGLLSEKYLGDKLYLRLF